jgi:hypothetical protein
VDCLALGIENAIFQGNKNAGFHVKLPAGKVSPPIAATGPETRGRLMVKRAITSKSNRWLTRKSYAT